MRKNIYVKPRMTVITVETESMMAASGDPESSVSATFDDENPITTGSVDAKGHSSLWDFDDDEEEY